MRGGSKLKIFVLVSVCLFVLGFWCAASAAPVSRATSSPALGSLPSIGPAYFCYKFSLPGFMFLFTAPKGGDLSGGGKAGAASDFLVFPAIDALSIEADPLSGQADLSFPKVSLHILNSVFIL